jgi:hypothetical protein
MIEVDKEKEHSPTPNVGSIANAVPLFHPLSDPDILSTMISVDPVQYAVDENIFEEERQNGGCSIIVVGTNTGHKAGVAIDEGVNNDMPSSQACIPQSAWAETETTLMTHHADHRGARASWVLRRNTDGDRLQY